MLTFALLLVPFFVQPTGETVETVRQGDHFELVCHFDNAAVADRALEALEAVWPRAAEIYDLSGLDGEGGEPVARLKVHLYRDAAAYEQAEAKLTQEEFKRNLAFAHFDSRSAHVALQPPLSDEALKAVGVPSQTLRLLAHEGAHLVRFTNTNNFRSHPGWLADGAAYWIAEKVMQDLQLLESIEADPHFSSKLVRAQQVAEQGKLPSLEEILLDETDALSFYERYDVRWLFFRFMIEGKHGQNFKQVLARARSLGGGAGFTQRLFDDGLEILGKTKLQSAERDFRKYGEAFEPEWDEVYRSLWSSDGLWVQAAFDKNAIAWRREPSGRKSYSISGELTLLPGEGRQMNLLVGKSEEGFFSLAFVEGGSVTLFEYLSGPDQWHQRGFADCNDLQFSKSVAFEVKVSKKRVRLLVNGAELVSGEAETLDLDGPWGLGAQSESAGIWKIQAAPGL